MAKFSDLPEHIIIEIMSWLPPESIFRCKCVQKSWKDLINDLIRNPKFVTKHLNNRKKKASSLMFKCFDVHKGGSLILYNYEDNKKYLRSIVKDLEPLLLPEHEESFRQVFPLGVSHCNGIICLTDYLRCHIFLCNPATRELKHLPNPSFPTRKYIITAKVGFGYDYVAHVYKVVRVCGRPGNFKAQVYTLGHDAWRDIELDQDEFIDNYTSVDEMHCKGFCYWLACNDVNSSKNTVHSFDMHNEESHTIPLPDIVQSAEYLSAYHTSLTECSERVVLLCFPKGERCNEKSIEIWLMRESFEGRRNSQSWTKRLSIGLGGSYKIPQTFLNSEELLIQIIGKGIGSYNMRTRKFRWIHKWNIRWFKIFYYVKSLVSVNGYTLDK